MSPDQKLFDALRDRNYEAAEAALAEGASINMRTQGMRSSNLFHFFMVNYGLEQARWLHEHGADIQAVDDLGDNALMRAVESNRRHEFDAAMEMGVNIDRANDRGVTPLLRAALFEHGEYYLKRLLEAGASPSVTSQIGTTPLLAATVEGRLEMVRMLFDAGADPRGFDEIGQNIIYSAVMSGKPKVLQLVLERTEKYRKTGEIDVNHSASNHSEPIAKAALFSAEMVLMLLREGANPNAQSKNKLERGMTPLMTLCYVDQDGEASLVKEALGYGANPKLRDTHGHNAFYYAIQPDLNGKGAVLKALIEAGLDPSTPVSPDAVSPLHLALTYERPKDEQTGEPVGPTRAEVVGAMLDMGFPSLPRAWVDLSKEERPDPAPVPLVMALATKDLDCAKVILEKGTPLNELDDQGLSVLHRLAPVSGMSMKELMAVKFTKMQLEQSQKAAKKTSEKARQQAAEVAAEVEAMESKAREVVATAAAWMSEQGADWNIRGAKGVTPAMTLARDEGNWMLGQIIKFHGADLSLKDDLGRTAADHALEVLNVEGLQAMVGHLENSSSGLATISGVWIQAVLNSPDVSPVEPENAKRPISGLSEDSFIAAALKNNASKDAERFQRRAAFVQALTTLPAVPELLEARDENGNTPLILAAATGQDDLVSVLLAQGANPNAQNHEGETAAIHAVAGRHSDIVRLLRACGADMNLASNEGHVPRDFLSSSDARTRAAISDADPADKPTLELPQELVDKVNKDRQAWNSLLPAAPDANAPRRRFAM